MAKKKKPRNKEPSKRYKKYKLAGNKLVREKTCPKCGPGNFLAEHKDRITCGSCGYCEFIKNK